MYASENVGWSDELRMDPKDERLVLMAYNVGKMETSTDELYKVKRQLAESEDTVKRLDRQLSDERRTSTSLRNSYYSLETKYNNLRKKTTKKKVVKK